MQAPLLPRARRWQDAWRRGVVLALTASLVLLNAGSSRGVDPAGAAETVPPLIELAVPAEGGSVRELRTIEVHFSEPVQGVEADDLLINGVAATNVFEFAPGQFVFSFTQPAEGQVTVSWRPEHGILDLTTPPNPFAAASWTYMLNSQTGSTDVMISEFMASNGRTLLDENSEPSDWIELFNSGESSISLRGWFLTDDPGNLVKWRFPDVALPANGFLVVFASEKNRTNFVTRLHTNFRLSAGGDYLALVSPATNIISAFGPSFPVQYTDISYGRVPGADAIGYFTQATPGARNVSTGTGFGPRIQFSQSGGPFRQPFTLELATPSAGATIRYTLDGNVPTNGSPVYVAPIAITNSMQVRARSFADGILPGPPRTETYLLLSNNVVRFTSDLPVMVIHSLGRGSPTASRQNSAHISLFEPMDGVTSLTNAPTFETRVGIKLRGSSTEGLAKSSFAVEFWDEFNLDQDRELLGLPADSDWVLYAPNIYDPIMIHNPFIHQLSRDMGRYSARTRFIEVYLNKSTGPIATNHYNGIYVLEEKIKVGPNRVDIEPLGPDDLQAPEVTGGFLLKVDRLDPGDGGVTTGGQTLAYVDPKEREVELPQRDPQEQYLRKYLADFNRSLTSTNWLDPEKGYAAFIDVDSWIKFHVLEVISGNVDSLVLSTYLHKPRNGKLRYGPHWDFDRALGSTDGRDVNPRNWNTGPFFSATWWTRLFRDRDFWQKWIDHYQDIRQSHLSLTNVHRLIDEQANEVRSAQVRERARWRVALRGGTYQTEINHMKNWVSNRLGFIDRQLVGLPQLSLPGGAIVPGAELGLTGPTNATIHYTLDGTDPRLPQGELSPAALTYSGPVTLNGNARVFARARNLSQRQTGGPPVSSPWSGVAAATYIVSTPRLIVTEIAFHPADPAPGDAAGASDFEFIELKNAGTTAIQLPGVRLSGGVEYTFTTNSAVTEIAAGQRVLIVKNRAAFLHRYPSVLNIAGEFTGSLADEGDRLALHGPVLEPIFDFRYDDAWQPLSDGFGFTLVLGSEANVPSNAGYALAETWRRSAQPGGSPGAEDPASGAVPRVFVNELHAHGGADRIELYNAGDSSAEVTGWFLTDDYRSPKKLRLPNRTIPAGGFLVVEETILRPEPGSGIGFSRFGDEVYLFSANGAGDLTGWVHGFSFGASEDRVSFGRHVSSDGREHFVAQNQPTLGAPNAGPRVNTLVIHEVRYSGISAGPVAGLTDEFIELRNTGTVPLQLFDPAHPNHTWRLRGEVKFDFPPGLILPPNGYVVVVGFDPQIDTEALAAFLARFGAGAGFTLLGPWQGRLNNSGGPVELLKPGEALLTGLPGESEPSMILVETVTYSPDLPWPPTPDGSLHSLQRGNPASFADDPANWHGGVATPGDTDSDRDGLPDRWEASNGLNPQSPDDGAGGDADNDGFSNSAELHSGTNPRDAGSRMQLQVRADANGLTLMAHVIPGRRYVLQYCDELPTPIWKTLYRFTAPSDGNVATLGDTPPATGRFYRLRTE